MRKMCVSTAKHGRWRQNRITHAAVLGPMPGYLISCVTASFVVREWRWSRERMLLSSARMASSISLMSILILLHSRGPFVITGGSGFDEFVIPLFFVLPVDHV